MKINVDLNTCGDGYWSRRVAAVNCTALEVPYINEESTFGELTVYFSKETWDTKTDGLIYTDGLFLEELINLLIYQGFSSNAANDVDYSEQGMQGNNYVSFDVGKYFLKEWLNK